MFCKQDVDLNLSKTRRIIIFTIGVIESMLFCGAVFGWPQLVFILKNEGIYGDLCMRSNNNAFNSASNFTSINDNKLLNFTSRINEADADTHVLVNNAFSDVTKSQNNSSNSFPSKNTLSTVSSNHSSKQLSQYNDRCARMNSSATKGASSSQPKIESCQAQDEQFALIYTIVIGCYSIPGVLIGYLLHTAGLRITRVLGCTMIAISFICLAAVTPDSPNLLYPAMILLALGGNTIRMCLMQFGDLFPKHRATAITLLSGIYAASASLFLIFKFMSSVGVSRSYVCWALAVVATLLLVSSFIMPIHHIPISTGPIISQSKDYKEEPLSSSLLSLSSLLHQYWFFISLFAMNNYQQSYNVWVTASSCTDEEVSLFSSLFSYSNLFTVFFAPIGGYFTDYVIKRARRKAMTEIDFGVKEIQANFLPLLVTSLSVAGMYLGLFFFHPVSIYLSLIAMVIARPCIIAISTAYIRIRFPAEHFNRLLGIYGTVTSALLLLQYPHFRWAQNMYYPAHGLSIALILLSFSNPFHLLHTSYIRQLLHNIDKKRQDKYSALSQHS